MSGRPQTVVFGLPAWTLSGPCTYVERVATGLRRRGHDTSVLLTEHDTDLVQGHGTPRPLPAALSVRTLPCGPADGWGARWTALERVLEELAPCTYVMLSDWRNNVVAPRLSDRVRRVGLVQADSALEREQALRLGPSWHAVVAVSEPLHFAVAHAAPHLAPRAWTIENAVPLPARQPHREPDGPLRLVWTGELRAGQKRLHDLLAIAEELERLEVDAVLTVVGDGPLRSELAERGAHLIAAGRLVLTGRLEPEALAEQLRRQDVVLLTSEFEGLSQAVLEAMAVGCIPVITDLSTHSELVEEGVNGHRVPIGDVPAFASRLAELATDPGRRRRLAAAAAATVRDRHDLEVALTRWERLLEAVEDRVAAGQLLLPRRDLQPPPSDVAGESVLPGDHLGSADAVNAQPGWPDAVREPRRLRPSGRVPQALEDHRILLALPSASAISGVDVFTHGLARELRRSGLDAGIVSLRTPEDPEDTHAEVPRVGPRLPGNASWGRRWRVMTSFLAAHPTIYLPNYEYELSCVSARLPGQVKVIPIAHSDDPAHYDHVARLAPACDAVVGVSRTIVDHIGHLAPELRPDLHLIPYGVDVSQVLPRRPHATLRVAYAGRLDEPQKRIGDVVSIARELARREVDVELTLIGDGPERQQVERALVDLVLDRRVRFLGRLDPDAAKTAIGQSDVLLLTSAFEGLSVAMLEAMALGTVPVVSSVRSGVPDVLTPGLDGLVADVGDVGGFVDHLTALATDRARLTSLSQAAQRTADRRGMSTSSAARRYVELFEELVGRSDERRPGPLVPPAYLRTELSPRARLLGGLRRPLRHAMWRLRRLGL